MPKINLIIPDGAEKPKRGGARPGTGRKPLTPEQREARKAELASRRKTIELSAEDIAAVEVCASADGISVHAWLVAAVRKALRSAE